MRDDLGAFKLVVQRVGVHDRGQKLPAAIGILPCQPDRTVICGARSRKRRGEHDVARTIGRIDEEGRVAEGLDRAGGAVVPVGDQIHRAIGGEDLAYRGPSGDAAITLQRAGRFDKPLLIAAGAFRQPCCGEVQRDPVALEHGRARPFALVIAKPRRQQVAQIMPAR